MRYWISGPTQRDLQEIWRYTNTNWGIEQADAYTDALIARFAWLTVNRPSWRERRDIQEGLHSYVQGHHVVLLRAGSGEIEIIRVLHRRIDLERHLS